ncbi:MAG: hypothetical protein JXB32_24820 [Deltaproteobacteria bacterium]|nr:hypothetical protein [Deltaproteobacteria bacterium]
MSGANHEKVPGQDAIPLIAVELNDAGGWDLVVRSWSGCDLVRRSYAEYAYASDAEDDLRAELVDAPEGDVEAVLLRWANRDDLDLEDWWA